MSLRTRTRQRRGAVTGLALCCALLSLPPPAGAAAAIEVRVERAMVAVRADDAPVGDILGLLVAIGLVEIEAAPALDERVTIATRPETIAALLRRLLRAYSYDLEFPSTHRAPRLRLLAPSGVDARDVDPPVAAAAVDRALAALASPDPDLREEAVLALADLGGPDAAVHISSRLGDESGDVREAVEAALEDLGATHSEPSGRLTGQVRE